MKSLFKKSKTVTLKILFYNPSLVIKKLNCISINNLDSESQDQSTKFQVIILL